MEVHPRVTIALERLKGLFLEIPDTRLSLSEAARLANLDTDLCHGILTALEDVRFLTRQHDGMYYRRASDPAFDRLMPVSSSLEH